MVVIDRTSLLSSSSSSRRTEKQSRSRENDNHEVIKGRPVKRASSFSALSSSSKKEEKLRMSVLKDSHERLKGKLSQRGGSLSASSSPRKKIQIMSSQKDCNELPKEKLARRASSVSSSSVSSPKRGKRMMSASQKESQVSSLSSSSVSSPKRAKRIVSTSLKESRVIKENQTDRRKSNLSVRSKMRELAPICKSRKEILNSIEIEEDIDVYLDRQITEEGKNNPDDCYWLSSGSMSPQEFGLFMSALDPCLDELVISFLPRSSMTPYFEGPRIILVDETSSVDNQVVTQGPVNDDEVNGCAIACSQSLDSSSSSLALSTYTNSSAFWNMDRTGEWVSLINLEWEDSKLVSDAISLSEDLESNFPSPRCEITWDSCSSEVGLSSSAKSTHESSRSDWSSDLLSDSVDWELDSEDPIFWPYGADSKWDQGEDTFSVSPRKGVIDDLELGKPGIVPTDSIKFRLHGTRQSSKDGIKRRVLYVSGLSASKIIEFKKGCRKNFAAATAARGNSYRHSKVGRRSDRFKRRVPPILETEFEGISPKDTPTKETSKLVNFSSDMLSESKDWGDEMDSDGPLVWPSDQKHDWDASCDFLNISPRKDKHSSASFGSPKGAGLSPKGGFAVSSSIRLKFRPKKAKCKPACNMSGIGASKRFKFKPGSHKTSAVVGRRVTAMPPKISPSAKSFVVIVPARKTSMFKSAEFKHAITRISAGHGKRIKFMPLKVGKSVEEFIRLVSIVAVNKKFPEAEDELPIETIMGLNAFDGHEGVAMDFEEDKFSLEDYMRD